MSAEIMKHEVLSKMAQMALDAYAAKDKAVQRHGKAWKYAPTEHERRVKVQAESLRGMTYRQVVNILGYGKVSPPMNEPCVECGSQSHPIEQMRVSSADKINGRIAADNLIFWTGHEKS